MKAGEVAWMLKSPSGVLMSRTMSVSRRLAIKKAVELYRSAWPKIYRGGTRAVRVQIREL